MNGSDLPEITLLVVDKNKQCNHSQHYLFRITSLLVFRYYSIHLSVLFPLSAFSFPQSPCSSVFQLKDTWSNYKVGSFSRNADEQGIQRDLKERKEHFLKNSGCKMILYFNQVARFHKYSSGPCAWRLILPQGVKIALLAMKSSNILPNPYKYECVFPIPVPY